MKWKVRILRFTLVFSVVLVPMACDRFVGAVPTTRPAESHPNAGALPDGSIKIAPPYAIDPEIAYREGVPRGLQHGFDMDSEQSKIYPGVKRRYGRGGSVYVPAQYVPGTAAPFIVVQDGLAYGGYVVPALDNLIAEKKIPVVIAIFINSGGNDSRSEFGERVLEYATISDRYVTFIETEVLPKVAADYNLKFTARPEGRAAMGFGQGGAAAFTMAWFRPDLYRRVLMYSGAFVKQRSNVTFAAPHGAWEYHENFIPNGAPKPLRVWMEAGELDEGYAKPVESLENYVTANNRLAAALKAKGYDYRYVFAVGAGNIDGKVVQQTLPEALQWLWRGYLAQ